jgi:tetratricopeptide (TPR) repeat protein
MITRFPDSPLPALYGYASSLFANFTDSRLEFYRLIVDCSFTRADAALFSHLLSEMEFFNAVRHTGLLVLMYGKCQERRCGDVSGSRLPIVLRVCECLSPSEPLPRFDDITNAPDAGKREIPYLDPVCEGYDLVSFPDDATVEGLVADGRFLEAISMATAALEADPKNVEMLKVRVRLLARIGKFADAIADCSRLITIEPIAENRALRNTLWMHFGQQPRTVDTEERSPAPLPRSTPLPRPVMPGQRVKAKWAGLW